MTALPTWTGAPGQAPGPAPGLNRARLVLPLGAGGPPTHEELLAAHARVLAELAGETEVVLGSARADGSEQVLRVAVGDDETWSGLLDAVRGPVVAAGDAAYDTAVLGSGAAAGCAHAGAALRLGTEAGGLVLDHRLDHLDPAAAERIGGYHLTALAAMRTDRSARCRDTRLVSSAERRHQLDDLAGPVRETPDRRVAQIVAERARRHPDRVALECAGAQLTYAELDARVNQVAHGLLARGLVPEDVVAVVLERDLEWAVTLLGVLRAGGTYLPVEPHFPAARIAASLVRSRTRFVVTAPPSCQTLDRALQVLGDLDPAPLRLLVEEVVEGQDEQDPQVLVGADQRAYIFFTSGSTGEPKGAECEHAGMLNHLLAKVEDLDVGDGAVVAQTAPQCFDISVWQLLAALLVGGRTLIVPQPRILDPASMVDTLRDGEVEVLQLVPSYLEVLLTHLDRDGGRLPALRTVSVTGEAVKPELVRRFFDTPGTAGKTLVNAYGLTETSDDTNHAVMRGAPAGDRVPLGPPVRNVTVYVVDPATGSAAEPVPLGAPGEIVFSGVCVGRGYVNDPERTAAAFGEDPHRPGRRLYRSGDFGRWLPDGSLEFLGRRDSQLKVAGFRIEIGDIESAFLAAPDVRDAAVVPVQGGDDALHLVGYYAAEDELGSAQLRRHLAERLPAYMVPNVLHHVDRLPLSDNGKVDRGALVARAQQQVAGAQTVTATEPPSTAAEHRVADVWSQVLGLPVQEISRTDDFLARGGSSLNAVKVVIALDRALTLKQVLATPVLADLAALLPQDPPHPPHPPHLPRHRPPVPRVPQQRAAPRT